MISYPIVRDHEFRVDQPTPHVHIDEVGIGSGPTIYLPTGQVLAMMDRGDIFYAVSRSPRRTTRVVAAVCTVCGRRTIGGSRTGRGAFHDIPR